MTLAVHDVGQGSGTVLSEKRSPRGKKKKKKKPQTFHAGERDGDEEPLTEACWDHNDAGHHDVWIDLVNATPYTWRKGEARSRRLKGSRCWEDQWPAEVPPGSSVSVRAFVKRAAWHSKRASGDVAYRLEGTEEEALFWVEWRGGGGDDGGVQVRLDGSLRTMNNGPTSRIRLGRHPGMGPSSPGSVSFVLAGKEGDFVSSGSPTGWMRRTLGDTAELALRDVAMPRSHHAGMYKNAESLMALPAATLTQTKPLYFQISEGGARVLDVRIARDVGKGGKFHESHGTVVPPGNWLGTKGAAVDGMVDQLNEFMRLVPGELFVWDVHEGDFYRPAGPGRYGARRRDYEDYYEVLKRIENRMDASPAAGDDGEDGDDDITLWPVKRFIGQGQSAVIIRVPQSWYDDPHTHGVIPSRGEGFVSTRYFPVDSAWTDTDDVGRLLEHQAGRLTASTNSKQGRPIFDMQFLHTTQGADNVFPGSAGIVSHASALWHYLHAYMWGFFAPPPVPPPSSSSSSSPSSSISSRPYPGWITVDDIRDESARVLAMAVNKCFAARRCGDIVSERKTFVYDYVWEGLEYEIA